MTQIEILTFPSGPVRTNAYLVSEGHEAMVIDPAPGSSRLLVQAIEQKKLTLTKIVLTHSHWDHIADVSLLLAAHHVDLFVHEEDAANLVQPGIDRVLCPISIQGVEPSDYLHEGDCVILGTSRWQIIHTPGHTPGGICLYCPEQGILFSGDTLFKRSIGILTLPTSEPARMWPSLKKLSLLPPETVVYPGHGEATTIGSEKWLSRAEDIFG